MVLLGMRKNNQVMNDELIDQYVKLHEKSKGYGAAATYLTKIAAICKMGNFQTVLDFGCGKGLLADKLNELGFDASKYDPAIPEFSALPETQFDMVVANDVLEHLHPDCYMADIYSMIALSRRCLFLNISCRPAVFKLPNGENCHTLIRSSDWWMSLFDSMKDVKIISNKYHPQNKNLELILTKNNINYER